MIEIAIKGKIFDVNTDAGVICAATGANPKTVRRSKMIALLGTGVDWVHPDFYPGSSFWHELMDRFSVENLEIMMAAKKEIAFWKNEDYSVSDDELAERKHASKATVKQYRRLFDPNHKARAKKQTSTGQVGLRLKPELKAVLEYHAKLAKVNLQELIRLILVHHVNEVKVVEAENNEAAKKVWQSVCSGTDSLEYEECKERIWKAAQHDKIKEELPM